MRFGQLALYRTTLAQKDTDQDIVSLSYRKRLSMSEMFLREHRSWLKRVRGGRIAVSKQQEVLVPCLKVRLIQLREIPLEV